MGLSFLHGQQPLRQKNTTTLPFSRAAASSCAYCRPMHRRRQVCEARFPEHRKGRLRLGRTWSFSMTCTLRRPVRSSALSSDLRSCLRALALFMNGSSSPLSCSYFSKSLLNSSFALSLIGT